MLWRRWVLLWMVGAAACATGPPPTSTPETLEQLTDLESVRKAVHPGARPLLVHVWALWCGACVEELPRQLEFARRLRAAGADVLFIDADGFTQEPRVRAHLKELGGLGNARQAMLDMELDVAAVTPLLSPEWTGLLPATFAKPLDGSAGLTVIGQASPQDERRLAAALSVQIPPEAVKPPPSLPTESRGAAP